MAEAQNLEKPVSVDDILSNNTPKAPKGEAQSIAKPIPFDEVFSQFQKDETDKNKKQAEPEKKGVIDTVADNLRKGTYSTENSRLGAIQRTNQVPKQEDYVGRAVHGEELGYGKDDPNHDAYFLQDEKGNYAPADTKKHVVFRDPDTGEHGIYNRDATKDRSAIPSILTGLGSLVQEGFQASPVTVGPLTRGQQALAAAERVKKNTDVHVPIAQSAVTENPVSPAVAKGLQALPGGSAPFDAAAARTETGLAGAAANATSEASSPIKAGEGAREAIEATAKPKTGVLAQRVSDAYDRVDAHMPEGAIHDLTETRKIAGNIQSRFEATRGESGTNKINPTLNEVLSAATDPKGVSYQGLKDLRTRVGEMLESGTNLAETGVSDKELRGLYKGLTDDLKGMVETHGGPRGKQMWERANTMARVASERRESLGKILGTQRSDEAVFSALERMAGSTGSADSKTLALAKKSMPADQWNEIAQTIANRLGKVKTDQGTHFDPGKFVKDYDKLSDRGKSILFGDQQRLRKALDSVSDLSKFQEPITHPGPVAHLLAAGTVINHTGHGEGGVLSRLFHVAAGVVSMKFLGNMLAKPATAESVAKWMEGYKLATLKPTKGNVTMFQRLSETLANQAAKEDRENIGATASKAGELAKRLFVLVSPNLGHGNGQ